MTHELPASLATWNEASRVRVLGDAPLRAGGRYILCWLQQALRARDNPVIDAAILIGEAIGVPVLVYHGLREDYPFASDRLHRFILGASRDVAIGCEKRGLACIQYVDRAAKREKGLVYRLAADAAAVVLEDQPAFVAQWQAERVAVERDGAVHVGDGQPDGCDSLDHRCLLGKGFAGVRRCPTRSITSLSGIDHRA